MLNRKRILCGLAAALLLLAWAPALALGPYNVTVNYMIVTSNVTANEEIYTKVPVVYSNAPDTTELGAQGTVPYTDEGLIKMRDFVGWTTVPKSQVNLSGDTPLYSPGNTLGDALGSQTTGEITLYAYYDGLFERWIPTGLPAPFDAIPQANQNINKHRWLKVYESVANAAQASSFLGGRGVKSYTQNAYQLTDASLSFSASDFGYTAYNKTIIAYYRPQNLNLPVDSLFGMNKGVAYVVKQDRVGQISQSEVNMTFYPPEGTLTASTIQGLEFRSYPFRVKAVVAVATDGTNIPLEVSYVTRSAEKDVFNVTVLDTSKTIQSFTVVAEPKNQNGNTDIENKVQASLANQYTLPMSLNLPANGGFQLPAALARTLAENGTTLPLKGNVDGMVRWQLFNYPQDEPILDTPSNEVQIGFVFPQVTFDKNTAALGDGAPQIVAQDVPAMEEDGTTLFVGALMPDDPAYTGTDGKALPFLGWNTRRDGSGTWFTSLSDVLKDITVYAQWQLPEVVYAAIQVPLKASKVLTNGALREGQFTFVLSDASGKEIARAANARDGSVVFPDRTFSKEVSNYRYSVRELAGGESDIRYDETKYTVKVSTRGENGVLKASVSLEKDGVPYDGDMVFTNAVVLPATGDDGLALPLTLLCLSLLLLGAYGLRRRWA